jgi:hypothetical protein
MHKQSTEITRAWRLIDRLDDLRLPRVFAGPKARLVDLLDARRDK